MPVFIIELDTTTLLPENRSLIPILEFPELPEPLSSEKSAIYHEEAVPGRSEPWISYNYSAARTITFTVKIVATGYWLVLPTRLQRLSEEKLSTAVVGIKRATSPVSGLIPSNNPVENAAMVQLEVHQRLAWLDALLHPQYDSLGRAFPPPAVYLTFGANFIRRGIITSIHSSYFGPWNIDLLLSHHVDVTITFKEMNLIPPGYADAITGIFGNLKTRFMGQSNAKSATTLARQANGL